MNFETYKDRTLVQMKIHANQQRDALLKARAFIVMQRDAFDEDCGDAGCDDCKEVRGINRLVAEIDAALYRTDTTP